MSLTRKTAQKALNLPKEELTFKICPYVPSCKAITLQAGSHSKSISGDLKLGVTEDEIRQHLHNAGTILSVIRNPNQEYAFVTFSSEIRSPKSHHHVSWFTT